MTSLWRGSTRREYPVLDSRIEVDAVVVGGGITGVLTAWALRDAGRSVALLEAGDIASGNTAGATGNLYGTVSTGLATVAGKWGDRVAVEVVSIRMAALRWIEELVQQQDIDCAFRRVPLWWCLGRAPDDGSQRDALESEARLCQEAGLEVSREASPADALAAGQCLRIAGQAQFDPWAFTRGVARRLHARGTPLFENSPVTQVDPAQGRVVTPQGEVRARHIVLATHTPLGVNLLQAEMEVHREHAIAVPTPDPVLPEGIIWLRDRSRSLRVHSAGGRHWLVLVGEKHKTGEAPPPGRGPARLAEEAARWFGPMQPSRVWSAQQFSPADALPYIGRSGHDAVLVATGFGADGLTWGAVAARLLADHVAGEASPFAARVAPRRFTPVKSARVWARENAHVLRHLVADRLRKAESVRFADIRPGEGRVVEADGTRVAVSRAPDGQLHVLSPVCPHLGCLVAWNGVDRSWDCPCHGSRFRGDGSRIEGPALRGLEPIDA